MNLTSIKSLNLSNKAGRNTAKSIRQLILIDEDTKLNAVAEALGWSAVDITTVKSQIKKQQLFIPYNIGSTYYYIALVKTVTDTYRISEEFRKVGAQAVKEINNAKQDSLFIRSFSKFDDVALLAAEGAALANYQFLKYKENPKDSSNTLKTIFLDSKDHDKKAIDQVQNIVDAVYHSRTLINEPLNFMTAEQLAKEAQKMGKKAGFKTTVFNKKRIEKENMSGLLAVNLGSPDPPSFSILEWKPKKFNNKKPIILVGKGVVYDTGGLSLKPTTNSMDFMKCDMSGAAAVIGAMYAIAANKLPLHVITLVPATDNRPGQNAYVPGDIIKMRDGLTVEVLNTDAEGRMILADALSYAQQYKPELVIDFATLTGSAMRAIGTHASAVMSKADRKKTDALIQSGFNTFERLIEFPLWDEYGEMMKSDIADIKNSGGPLSGMMTAGKFLENFTDYPWIHIDIAPTAWNFKDNDYRLKNGVGVGVRLLLDFLNNYQN